MCLLTLIYKTIPEYPVIVAANRDEFYDRRGGTPCRWGRAVRFLAPRDDRGGGTWLGCNEHGVIVAVTNRHPETRDNPSCRSRGLLVTDLLGESSVNRAQRKLELSIQNYKYNHFNLISVSLQNAFIAHYAGRLRIRSLRPGLYAIANSDINDPNSARVGKALTLIKKAVHEHSNKHPGTAREDGREINETVSFPPEINNLIESLQKICAYHHPSGDQNQSLCVHGSHSGTLSSSLIALEQNLAKNLYLHAFGNPCNTPYEDYSRLLAEILPLKKTRL